jgi:DNA-binding XRE family transcriptional regulator
MVPAMSDIPNRVRELRATIFKGELTQQQLADRAGINPSTLSDIETQKTNPSALTALAIARVLGVTVEDLFLPAGTDGLSVDSAAPAGSTAPRSPALVSTGPDGTADESRVAK